MLELNIDPFSEDTVEHQGEEEDIQVLQKRPPKPPPEERLKPPPLQEKSESKRCSHWPRLIMEQDDKIIDINIDPFSQKWAQPFEEQDEPPLAERLNPPPLQEKSEPKRCSQWWWLIVEEDDEMLPSNIDLFSEEWEDEGLRGDKAEEETNHSLQEIAFN